MEGFWASRSLETMIYNTAWSFTVRLTSFPWGCSSRRHRWVHAWKRMVPFWSTMFLPGQLVDDRGSDIVDLIGDPVCGWFDLRRTDICVAVHQELYSYLLSSEEKSLMTRILILFHNKYGYLFSFRFLSTVSPRAPNHFCAYFPY